MSRITDLTGLALALLTISLAIGAAQEPARQGVAQVQLERITLSSIDTDSADFELTVSATAKKSITLREVFFQQLMVNSVAIRVAPLPGPLKLRPVQDPVSAPLLTAHVAFREVPSLAPLREIVSEGVAHVHGVVLVQLELNPLEMFALGSTDAWSEFNIDQDVPVQLPGGLLGRTAALAALTAAEPVWVLGSEGREWRRNRSAFAAQAEDGLLKSAIPLECTYEIAARSGETTILRNQSLAFMLPSGRILTTAEAVEPWAFDNTLAQAISRHDITVTPESVEILVRLQGALYSTKTKELKILKQHGDKKRMVSSTDKTSYRVRFRNTADNAVVIELTHSRLPQPGYPRATPPNIAGWQPAAVLRTDLDSQTAPYIWLTEVKTEDGRLILKDSAGVTALGSPIWTDAGIVGLMQDDISGVALANLAKVFPLEFF